MVSVDVFCVGSSADSHLQLNDESVAPKHFTIALKDGQVWLKDEGSPAGTFVNGKKVEATDPVKVEAKDAIVAGKSDCQLYFSPAPTVVARAPKVRPLNVVPNIPPAPPAFKGNQKAEEIERFVHEAQLKAATILQEAEAEAEKRVHEIYERAQETELRTNEIRQQRINEAFREAEEIYKKASEESRNILSGARKYAAEIRDQAEAFVRDLRARTESDCERILEDAQQTARQLKRVHTDEADEDLRLKEESIVAKAQEVAREHEAALRKEIESEMVFKKAEFEQEMVDRLANFEMEQKHNQELATKLKIEVAELERHKLELSSRATDSEQYLVKQTEKLTKIKAELDEAKSAAEPVLAKVQALRAEKAQLEKMSADIDARVKETQARFQQMLDEEKRSTEAVRDTIADNTAQLVSLRDQLANAKAKMQEEEKVYFENLKLQTARKMAELEKQMLSDMAEKQERLVRSLVLKAETFMKEHPNASAEEFKTLEDTFSILLDVKSSDEGKTADVKNKLITAAGLQRQQRLITGFVGLLLGACLALAGDYTYRDARGTNPLLDQVTQARTEREQDLERRRFNPEQTPQVRDTYMDSVVYTKDYVEHYLSDDYQKALLKALAPYMFVTWRTEEDKVIKLLAISTALVKNLDEKKSAIHPDFVPQGLAKMKDLEKETQARMRELLGTQVRYESFRSFENHFYSEHKF